MADLTLCVCKYGVAAAAVVLFLWMVGGKICGLLACFAVNGCLVIGLMDLWQCFWWRLLPRRARTDLILQSQRDFVGALCDDFSHEKSS